MEPQQGIFGHGGCGSRGRVDRMASTPNSVNAINLLRDTRQRIPAMPRIRRAKASIWRRGQTVAKTAHSLHPIAGASRSGRGGVEWDARGRAELAGLAGRRAGGLGGAAEACCFERRKPE